MKILFLLLFSFLSFSLHAGTCTSISRSNYSANSVLTASALNSDFNTVYNATNSLDGGCIQDGTLESTALNSSDFSALYYGIQQGCKVAFSDSNTLSIGKCIASVNGALLRTTIATTVTWGCTSCSSEVASTLYYVYIKTGSSGSTMNLLISTTAPNVDGYDNSGNKVLARFYNDASSNITATTIDNWLVNSFVQSETGWTAYTPTFTGFGTAASVSCFYKRLTTDVVINCTFNAGTTTATEARVTLPSGMVISSSFSARTYGKWWSNVGSTIDGGIYGEPSVAYFTFVRSFGAGNINSKLNGTSITTGELVILYATIPVQGWL